MKILDVLKRGLTRNRDSRRKQVAALITIDSLEFRLLLTAPTMTDSEQYMLELVNRARANPSAEAARLGIGLNDGVPAARTITTAAKQPLAPQQQLITAAGLHSQDMLDRDYFDHTTKTVGTTFSQRVTNAGYIWSGVAENIGYAAKQSAASQTVYINEIHDRLIRSSGHRENIMAPGYEELGIGAKLGSFIAPQNQVTYQFTEMVTQDFGRRNLDPYITGVVYTDANNNNNLYTIGESIRSGTVSAVNVSTGAVFSDTIGVSGAYGFVVPAGTYTVTSTFTLHNANQSFQKPGNIVVGTDNVKVDFETNSGVLVPLAISLASTVTTLNENGATASATMTVTRNGSPASSLNANLGSNDTTEVTVPATVVIPAGQLSATFTASAFNDGVIDGNRIPGASTYDVWINRLTSSTIEYLRNTSVIGNALLVSSFDVGSYGIRVRAKNSAGDLVGWSPQGTINVSFAPAGISVLATGLTATPSLTWSPVDGAALYDVWIDNLTTGASAVVRNSSVQGTNLELSGIPPASYRAFVRGRDLPGGRYYEWSSAFDFEVGRAPRITSPTGNDPPVRPTITWTSVSGAARYEIWLANLTTGIREISDTNVLSTSYTPTTDLTNSHNYRVWIKAFDSFGAAALWSLPVTFTVASNSVKSRITGEPLSPIRDPVLEYLFASADRMKRAWEHSPGTS